MKLCARFEHANVWTHAKMLALLRPMSRLRSLLVAWVAVGLAGCVCRCPPLFQALERSDSAELRRVLQSRRRALAARRCKQMGHGLLAAAARVGCVEATALLVAHGWNLEEAGEGGPTPLLLAAMYGHSGVVRCLLDAGAESNTSDDSGLAPLHWSAKEGDCESISALISAGAHLDASGPNGFTPLAMATLARKPEAMKVLLTAGTSPNGAGRARPPLCVAAASGRVALADLLFSHGAEIPLSVDAQGDTPLHYAAAKLHAGMCEYLLEKGVDVGQVNDRGETALMAVFLLDRRSDAWCQRRAATISRLLAGGADPHGLTPQGESLIDLARRLDCSLAEGALRGRPGAQSGSQP